MRDIRGLRISLASPESILSLSHGEVTSAETINYRNQRPERGGLFDEVIFGPVKPYECSCGKYKGPKYKYIVCDKCGVEVNDNSVRRERMGHIRLAAPVVHPWYFKRTPSPISILLGIKKKYIEQIIYHVRYIIYDIDENQRKKEIKRLNDEYKLKLEQIKEEAKRYNKGKGSRNFDKILELKRKISEINTLYDKKLIDEVNHLMGQAQVVQQEIEKNIGHTINTPLVLFDSVIVEGGQEITRECLNKVKTTCDEIIKNIEEKMKRDKDELIAPIEKEINNLQLKVNVELRKSLEDLSKKADELEENYNKEIEEINEIYTGRILTESMYQRLSLKYSNIFKAGSGANAIYEILKRCNLDEMAKSLRQEIDQGKNKIKVKECIRKLRIVEAFRKSNARPEWMILFVLPVIPPDLRPMVTMDGGRYATSDLNVLYKRVINRNNRLKKLIESGAPEIILRNEMRMLQESVDLLIDSSTVRRSTQDIKRTPRSLSDMLRGKKGLFRKNLLGKRVDYSGRSVIVVGPNLKLNQCGLPKVMAIELFKPFVIRELIKREYAYNVKGAKRIIERGDPYIWDILEDVVKERPVLLNRAPTLHRLGIQAFDVILTEGKAIQLHPLVCQAFNADFDGDQMAVHVPLSQKAVEEARKLMMSTNNLLKPADGESIVNPTKDMVLGIYYLTFHDQKPHKGDNRAFASIDEVIAAYHLKQVDIHARIKLYTETYYDENNVRYQDNKPRKRIIETTVGRAIFNDIVPKEIQYINRTLNKSDLQVLLTEAYRIFGLEQRDRMVQFADAVKDMGFHFATKSGITFSLGDIKTPTDKEKLIFEANKKIDDLNKQYRRGLMTEEELENKTISVWSETKDEIAAAVKRSMAADDDLSMMAVSGATKGGFVPITQIAGMRGLMADPSGRIIPMPIQSNFKEGLSSIEFFISTHGQRKGLVDTAMRTANAGYLTRRLIDVVQDVYISTDDCGTNQGIYIRATDAFGQKMRDRLFGRVLASDVVHPQLGIIYPAGTLIDASKAEEIQRLNIQEVHVRSPLTCRAEHGICKKCYGMDLARGNMVAIGAAVGIIAAQSIGEPGTQLTLRTFHTGGVAMGSDITQGLTRVEEIFEARKNLKGEAIISEISGNITLKKEPNNKLYVVVESHGGSYDYPIPNGYSIKVTEGQKVTTGDLLATSGARRITTKHAGIIERVGRILRVHSQELRTATYPIPAHVRLTVQENTYVEAGDAITDGIKNPHLVLKYKGRVACQLHILSEIQKIYRIQGVNIHDKHFEVIIRKMTSKVQVVSPGDSPFLPGDYVDYFVLDEINKKLQNEGQNIAVGVPVLLGISKVALMTHSFLSAASFQHTTKMLIQSAIEGRVDFLSGLKENVIIGKMIPCGTGMRNHEIKEYEGITLHTQDMRDNQTNRLNKKQSRLNNNNDFLDEFAQGASM
ncbi:MAG: DNA-directed RNA polymerase subunit beta' [Methylacidiphilales bacterium]|nr:DNA-directed RNA polymerase subunit beta' [Candidatus Methylacidiphilales bacterium]